MQTTVTDRKGEQVLREGRGGRRKAKERTWSPTELGWLISMKGNLFFVLPFLLGRGNQAINLLFLTTEHAMKESRNHALFSVAPQLKQKGTSYN